MTQAISSLFDRDTLDFVYEPYPLGYGAPVFAQADYQELLASWPRQELFEFMPKLGSKYSLSEVNAPDNYHRFIRETPCWNRVYRWVKDERFVRDVLELLKRRNIDLGLSGERVDTLHGLSSPVEHALARLRGRGRRLRTRFEFSMMPADGGHILPHTDHPTKRVTLVFSMNAPGEWQPQWGGGTAVQKPRDPGLTYNQLNQQIPFDDCEVLRVFPFEPNQCLLFIKTFNSLHAVYPMTGPAGVMRRTLTVNLELLGE